MGKGGGPRGDSLLCSPSSKVKNNVFLPRFLFLPSRTAQRSRRHHRPQPPAAWRSQKVGVSCFALGTAGVGGSELLDSSEPPSGRCWVCVVPPPRPRGWIEKCGATGHFSGEALSKNERGSFLAPAGLRPSELPSSCSSSLARKVSVCPAPPELGLQRRWGWGWGWKRHPEPRGPRTGFRGPGTRIGTASHPHCASLLPEIERSLRGPQTPSRVGSPQKSQQIAHRVRVGAEIRKYRVCSLWLHNDGSYWPHC